MSVQRCCSGEDEEIHNGIGKQHSRDHISSRGAKLLICRSLSFGDRGLTTISVFFHFLSSLPEEEIGRDGGSENANQNCHVMFAELDVRNEGGAQHFRPMRPCEELSE